MQGEFIIRDMMVVFLVICILLLFAICVDYADTHRLKVRYYTIETNQPVRLKLCLLADLHGKECGRENERLIAAVEREKPDLIISAGDLMTAGNEMDAIVMKPALHLIQVLAAQYPVYAAHGNHEQKMLLIGEESGNDRMQRFEADLRERGAVLLRDEAAKEVPQGTEIFGLEIPLPVIKKEAGAQFTAEDIRERIGDADPERFSILIAHDPAQMKAYTDWGADLVLSGHVHGGIIRLPLIGGVVAPPFVLFPRYDAGLFTERKDAHETNMVISAGLGEHTLPFRFNNPRELAVITVKGK